MTDPGGWGAAGTDPAFAPEWLNPNDVKEWLRLHHESTDDDGLIVVCAATTEPYVERCRPEWRTATGYTPDAETYHGAVMYAARQYRRRNSPAGIETFGDVTSFVSRYDPDIDRALQTGSYARPVVS